MMSIQNKIDEVSQEIDKVKHKILRDQRLNQIVYRFGNDARRKFIYKKKPVKAKLKTREDHILKRKIDKDMDELMRVAKILFKKN